MFFIFFLFDLYFFFTFQAFAVGVSDFPYGHDVSYPQCVKDNYLHAGSAFGVVGVTGGKAFTKNLCLGNEFGWAKNLFSEPSVYINVHGAIGRNASNAFFVPKN